MKTTTAILGLLIITALNTFAEDTAQEQDFKSRLVAFQKSGDMQQATNICEYCSPNILTVSDTDQLELVILRGIKSVEFQEVLPGIKDTKQGVNIDGSIYVLNLEPYKMVVVKFQTTVANASSGFGLLTGIKDGRIMICGYKTKDK